MAQGSPLAKVISGDLESIWKIKGNNTYKDGRVGWLLIDCIANNKGITRN